jgi:hypothetical protein
MSGLPMMYTVVCFECGRKVECSYPNTLFCFGCAQTEAEMTGLDELIEVDLRQCPKR